MRLLSFCVTLLAGVPLSAAVVAPALEQDPRAGGGFEARRWLLRDAARGLRLFEEDTGRAGRGGGTPELRLRSRPNRRRASSYTSTPGPTGTPDGSFYALGKQPKVVALKLPGGWNESRGVHVQVAVMDTGWCWSRVAPSFRGDRCLANNEYAYHSVNAVISETGFVVDADGAAKLTMDFSEQCRARAEGSTNFA